MSIFRSHLLDNLASYFLIFAFFCFPFSTALFNLGFYLSFVVCLVLIAQDPGDHFDHLLRQKHVYLPIVLFIFLLFSGLWSDAPKDDLLLALGKYSKLLLFLAFVPILVRRGYVSILNAFILGCASVAIISLGTKLGLTELVLGLMNTREGWALFGTPERHMFFMGGAENPTVGRSHIGQSTMHVVAALFAAGLMLRRLMLTEARGTFPWPVYAITISLTSLSVLMLQSRTGYLLLLAGVGATLGLLALQPSWRVHILKKNILIGLALVCLPSIVYLYIGGHTVGKRIAEVGSDVRMYNGGEVNSSQAIRLSLWAGGVDISKSAPILGSGLGSFAHEYSTLDDQPRWLRDSRPHPHSEYLLQLVQGGLVALLLYSLVLLAPLHTFWRYREETLLSPALPAIIVLAISSIFNSVLWDHGEGHLLIFLLMCNTVDRVHQNAKNAVKLTVIRST